MTPRYCRDAPRMRDIARCTASVLAGVSELMIMTFPKPRVKVDLTARCERYKVLHQVIEQHRIAQV
jgi:hypothetical protein